MIQCGRIVAYCLDYIFIVIIRNKTCFQRQKLDSEQSYYVELCYANNGLIDWFFPLWVSTVVLNVILSEWIRLNLNHFRSSGPHHCYTALIRYKWKYKWMWFGSNHHNLTCCRQSVCLKSKHLQNTPVLMLFVCTSQSGVNLYQPFGSEICHN